jgi:hypothetical protein
MGYKTGAEGRILRKALGGCWLTFCMDCCRQVQAKKQINKKNSINSLTLETHKRHFALNSRSPNNKKNLYVVFLVYSSYYF